MKLRKFWVVGSWIRHWQRQIQDFPGWGSQPINWPNFPNKLDENEENWIGGRGRPKFYYVDPLLDIVLLVI